MNQDEASRQNYYQQIARCFLRHQTTMFFLPPRDLVLISDWERLGIPLEPILEGIDQTFSKQLKRKKKRNIYSLSQCEKEILKAYASYQDRMVGQAAPNIEPGKKTSKARAEIEAFLVKLPPEFEELKELFKKALAVLSQPEPDENKLEELDEEIDLHLWKLAPEEQKEAGLQEVQQEFPGKPVALLTEIQQTRLIKARRLDYKIPYVSLFYY
ncbi:MAG TPA: hypothetical protein PLP57_09655 [Candidatus Saccharicenans sp.]|jgi:hypothetical protein|nr:hypothetical protein [Candidatus Saccharicenans sp.]HRD02885.1 hypothetical protein [Candidatus Saccharicenans sp.]